MGVTINKKSTTTEQNLVGVLSYPGVADMQTPLKSANMLQMIMYI